MLDPRSEDSSASLSVILSLILRTDPSFPSSSLPVFHSQVKSKIFTLCPLTLPCLFALVVLAAASPSLSLPVSYLGVELGLENRLEGKRKTCYTSVLGGGGCSLRIALLLACLATAVKILCDPSHHPSIVNNALFADNED